MILLQSLPDTQVKLVGSDTGGVRSALIYLDMKKDREIENHGFRKTESLQISFLADSY